MTKIKICGLKRLSDIECVNSLCPDYIGYVFWEKSKRFVTCEQAEDMTHVLSDSIVPVGVFVDHDVNYVASLLNSGTIKIAQLHGHEDGGYIKRLRQVTDRPIWKAFKVRNEDDLKLADECMADMVLLDNGYGTGESFDWRIVRNFRRPYMLAGGLTPQNVCEAIGMMSPFGVDVSSGVETGGVKDREKIKQFISIVRSREEM